MKKLLYIGISALVLLAMTCVTALGVGKARSQQPLKENVAAWNGYEDIIEQNKKDETQKVESDIPTYSETSLLFGDTGVFDLGKDACLNDGLSGWRPNYTGAILTAYPDPAIRERKDGSIYFMYDTDTGYRLYLYFAENNEFATCRGFPIVVKETLPYKAFSGLQVGDSITKVEAIDTAASLQKKSLVEVLGYKPVSAQYNEDLGNPLSTIHYLKDGILLIQYHMEEDYDLTIINIQYSEDYTLQHGDERICYQVYEQDLP